MFLDNIVEINKVAVRKEVFETKFVCDLNKCKGACCTLESQYGAPLLKDEIKIIENLLPDILPYISEKHKEEIETNGFWEEKEGNLLIRSLNNKDCVFARFENGIAKCGIEKAYFDNKINFQKPISCHLFPIRISNFGGDILRFEKFKECHPAIENGSNLNVTVANFCKDSLTRLYGKDWFDKLSEIPRS
ncbi:MAG: DUF3109 family protein [Ignavibacteriales bacterium]|nr:DUF3109 family protein [Ignavibacteriales bacterium]